MASSHISTLTFLLTIRKTLYEHCKQVKFEIFQFKISYLCFYHKINGFWHSSWQKSNQRLWVYVSNFNFWTVVLLLLLTTVMGTKSTSCFTFILSLCICYVGVWAFWVSKSRLLYPHKRNWGGGELYWNHFVRQFVRRCNLSREYF